MDQLVGRLYINVSFIHSPYLFSVFLSGRTATCPFFSLLRKQTGVRYDRGEEGEMEMNVSMSRSKLYSRSFLSDLYERFY